ncbi:MAG: TerC/Alx family metal homeostasis membrane protein [Candidatus Omnitrophica bacterium]|nr:TerC/Alx family metal homeostasis membrane protein [Candidatus Omnitrophota bacterium]
MSPVILWGAFALFIAAMLWADFRLFSGRERAVGIREALLWSLFWLLLALGFNVGIYFLSSHERAVNFLTGYLIERALSMDNIFVFLLIFNFFRVPQAYQQAVLFWGIILALALRAVFIALGVVVISLFHWSIYVLGAFLVFVGIKMLFAKDEKKDLAENPVLKFIQRALPITKDYQHKKFFVRTSGGLSATPLFVVFLMVAVMDIVFAVDSIPAILAVTTDPLVVYTSNIFAILGLRALYSAVAAMATIFRFLNIGLSLILVLIGIKMLASDRIHLPVVGVLAAVGGILAVSVLASVIVPNKRSS